MLDMFIHIYLLFFATSSETNLTLGIIKISLDIWLGCSKVSRKLAKFNQLCVLSQITFSLSIVIYLRLHCKRMQKQDDLV